jgi:hypothetical protein
MQQQSMGVACCIVGSCKSHKSMRTRSSTAQRSLAAGKRRGARRHPGKDASRQGSSSRKKKRTFDGADEHARLRRAARHGPLMAVNGIATGANRK